MATITIKINEKTQDGKTFLELVNFFHSKKKSVEIVKEKSPYNPEFVKMVKDSAKAKGGKLLNTKNVWDNVKEKSPYNPAFVKMIKKSQAQIKEGKFKTLNTEDVWGSLGL